MGYTRYWERTDKAITDDFVAEVNEIIEECTAHGITIRDGFGEGEPVVSLEKIWINGTDENDLGHETFYLGNEPKEFDFCKTACKPYDYAVREILKVAELYGLVVNVRDDGKYDEIISDADYIEEYR